MTITNGYCTLAELKARLASTISTEDAMLEDIITFASRKIDADTGRRFYTTAADETRTFFATDYNRLWGDDIISITTLKTDSDGDGTFENTWATTDYLLLPTNAALDGQPYNEIRTSENGSYTFPVTDYASVQVVGKFGFAATTVAETRDFTAPLSTLALVNNLASITSLATDADANGTYETTWTVTTDYTTAAVAGTFSTLITACGAKTFPVAANGVRIVGTWNAAGVPAAIKEACIIASLSEYQMKYMFSQRSSLGGALINSFARLDDIYRGLIAPYVRYA